VHAQAAASGGFGKTNKKKVETGGGMVLPKKFKNITDADLSDDNASASKQLATADGPAGFPQGASCVWCVVRGLCACNHLAPHKPQPITRAGWTDLKLKADAFPLGKTAKPVELVGGRALMVYRYDGKVFVSDANSTAYQYPMTDARLFKDAETGRVAAEVPLVRQCVEGWGRGCSCSGFAVSPLTCVQPHVCCWCPPT
jgi:hypothetical protein